MDNATDRTSVRMTLAVYTVYKDGSRTRARTRSVIPGEAIDPYTPSAWPPCSCTRCQPRRVAAS